MKKVISMFLITAVVLFATIIPSAAKAVPTVYPESVLNDNTDEITVDIKISHNPGLISLRMFLQYDESILTLKTVSNGNVFKSNNAVFGNVFRSPYTMLWVDELAAENYTSDGILATLVFDVNADVNADQTEISVAIDNGSTFNFDFEDVIFTVEKDTVPLHNIQSSDDAVSIDYQRKLIVVNSRDAEFAEQYLHPSNDLSLVYKYNENNIIGSASEVFVKDSSDNTVDKYTFVVKGDLNGDGYADGMDSVIVNCLIENMLTNDEISDVIMAAADYNLDGTVNRQDADLIEMNGLFI